MRLRYRLARLLGHMPYLRLGLRRRLVKALAAHDKVPPASFEAAHFGGLYRGDIANAQEWHVYFFGGYELKELALIRDVLTRIDSPVALDIGGNLGGHSLTMARYASQVHTFEPFPPLASRIEQLMALNGRSNVAVHVVGLGAEAAKLDYHLDTESRNQGTGSFLADHTDSAVAATLDVVRGDSYLEGKLDRLDFIKIDIEGFEAPALAGLAETLRRFAPVVMMEVTESSAKLIEEFGGLAALLPFAHRLWEIENPAYPLGILQTREYRLAPIAQFAPRRASYNLLIVPDEAPDAVRALVAA